MTVGSIIAGGVRLIRRQPQVVAIWAVLYVMGMTLFRIAMGPTMARMMDAQRQTAAHAAMAVKSAAFLNVVGLELILALLTLVAFAAVVRAVARPAGDRFLYLRLGMDELRLTGLALLLALLIFLAEFAAILSIAIFVGLSTFLLGKIGAIVVGAIIGIALFCAAIYAEVRISLAGAFTVLEGRIALRDAWRATKGHFWTLFGAYLLMGLAFLIFVIAAIALTNPQLLAAYANHNPQAIMAAAQAQYSSQASGITIGFVARMVVGAAIAVPMYIVFFGAVATAAVELRGIDTSVAAAFE
jgi:hypothetical protein